MTEIIRSLRGHHEPQEEVVFHRVIERLAASRRPQPVMVELGSFWAYYSLWFCRAIPGGRVIAMEPDPVYLEVGRRNFALNGLSEAATFVHGVLGAEPGVPLEFTAESTGTPVSVAQHDLRSLMELAGIDRVDLLLADVQGAEEVLLARAGGDLATGRVRFLIVSTHHHSISGDPLTHQRALSRLTGAGAHVIAEHSVPESFSGDGLIAVSFDERDRDLVVAVSHARARDSLFGELEIDLDAERRHVDESERRALGAEARLAEVERELRAAEEERNCARADLAAIEQTRIWRWSRPARALAARVRGADRSRPT
jgi:FkbM family methyltransferase